MQIVLSRVAPVRSVEMARRISSVFISALYHEYAPVFKHSLLQSDPGTARPAGRPARAGTSGASEREGMRMKSARALALGSILKGLLVSAAATLLGMLLLAAAVIYLDVSDGALTALNQALKLICVLLGVRFAVGLGGERGFLTGAAVGLAYMILGYVLYWRLGGAVFSFAAMLLEMLLGGAIGAVAGAVCANLRPRARRKRGASAKV